MKKEGADSKQETEESGVGVLDASSDWISKPLIREESKIYNNPHACASACCK
jgi:hypothetical protein